MHPGALLPAPLPLITGATLQINMDARLGVTHAAGIITAWADQSGNGRDVAEVAGSGPGYLTSGGIGGLASLNFTAIALKYLRGTGWVGFVPRTIYCVFTSTQAGAKQFAYTYGTTIWNTSTNIAPPRVSIIMGAPPGGGGIMPYAMAGVGGLACGVADLIDSAIYMDDMATPILVGVAQTETTSAVEGNIGIASTLVQPLNGQLAQLLMYADRHSLAQRQQTKAALRSVWGILGG